MGGRIKFRIWFFLLLLAVVWGSSFILIKKGLEVFSYQQVGALRLIIVFLSVLPIAVRQLRKIKQKHILPLFVVGIFGNTLPIFLFPKAQTVLDSALVGILNSLVPLFTLIIGFLWFRLRVQWFHFAGILLGLAGVSYLLLPNYEFEANAQWYYAFYAIGATVCYAISLNTIKSYLAEVKSVTIAALSFGFVGLPTCVYLFFTPFIEVVTTTPPLAVWESLGYIAILAVAGTTIALIIFNELIKDTTALFASLVTYLIPIVAIIWGLIDGEAITAAHFIGLGLILLGVFLVNMKKSKGEGTVSKDKKPDNFERQILVEDESVK